MPDQPSLELIIYQLNELRVTIEKNHSEMNRRMDKKDSERAALVVRVDGLERWQTERITLLAVEENARSNRDKLLYGLLSGIILLVFKDLWTLFR